MPHSLHVGAPSCALLGEVEPVVSAIRVMYGTGIAGTGAAICVPMAPVSVGAAPFSFK
jgi:hypothetical protein